MDGFEQNIGIIVVAATNRPDVLDPALLRPGRFDRQVVVDRPDVRGREGILKVHARHIPLAPDVNLEIVARGTPGLSGADLANLMNEAALFAGKLYLNVHTGANGGGEMRGFLIPAVPEPSSSLVAMAAVGALALRRRRA